MSFLLYNLKNKFFVCYNFAELGDRGQSQYSALQDVTGVLLNFINTNPEAWAPIVSSVGLNSFMSLVYPGNSLIKIF